LDKGFKVKSTAWKFEATNTLNKSNQNLKLNFTYTSVSKFSPCHIHWLYSYDLRDQPKAFILNENTIHIGTYNAEVHTNS